MERSKVRWLLSSYTQSKSKPPLRQNNSSISYFQNQKPIGLDEGEEGIQEHLMLRHSKAWTSKIYQSQKQKLTLSHHLEFGSTFTPKRKKNDVTPVSLNRKQRETKFSKVEDIKIISFQSTQKQKILSRRKKILIPEQIGQKYHQKLEKENKNKLQCSQFPFRTMSIRIRKKINSWTIEKDRKIKKNTEKKTPLHPHRKNSVLTPWDIWVEEQKGYYF